MTIYECDRCHKQFNDKKAIHMVDITLHDWIKGDSYWKDTGGGRGELCVPCVNEICALFNDFMKGVNPYGKTESDTGNGD